MEDYQDLQLRYSFSNTKRDLITNEFKLIVSILYFFFLSHILIFKVFL